jgi:hypothetical protein
VRLATDTPYGSCHLQQAQGSAPTYNVCSKGRSYPHNCLPGFVPQLLPLVHRLEGCG